MAELVTKVAPRRETDGAERRLGLALSGGGFRTALFHVGVLMRLAETGVLKHVSVISAVSGGSIVGATFLLHLREQLRGGPVSDEEMVGVVARVARAVSAGAAANVRVRALTSWPKLVRMAMPDYSRSDRVAELFERYCFPELGRDAEGKPIKMRDLTMPIGTPAEGLQPLLMLNATSLNSGRNWTFSQQTMGEPRRVGIPADIDKALRFEASDGYGELVDHGRDVPMRVAVAASAALPGALHPMSISEMYRDHRVQLTDGGVHDNQGIQALIDKGCTVFFVSDTGGQLMEEEHARPWLLQVLLRSSQIQYGRVRQEQLFRVMGGRNPPSPLALAHLRRGIDVAVIPYERRPGEVGDDPGDYGAVPTPPSDRFGIDQRVMRKLADLRTDLDAFTEVERASLKSAGYLVTADVLRSGDWLATDLAADLPITEHAELGLGRINGFLADPTPDYLHQLDVGRERFWKVFRMPRTTAGWFKVVGPLAFLGVLALIVRFWRSGIPLWSIGFPVLVLSVLLFLQASPERSRVFELWPVVFAIAVFNAIWGAFACAWAHAYLWTLGRFLARQGTIRRLEWLERP